MTTNTAPAGSAPVAAAAAAGRADTARIALISLAILFFFISGAAGLIYQVAWVRQLSLVFGVTIYALSAVLAGFMGGLAVGSFFGGSVAIRLRRPLFGYGVIELLIAGLGALTPVLFGLVRDVYPVVYNAAGGGDSFIADTTRVVMAFAIILVPTSLMGLTLPVILRSSLIAGATLGRGVALLYAINTAGAIAGTLLAGFVLIAQVGVMGAIWTAVLLNLVAGLGAIATSVLLREGRPGATEPAGEAAGP